MSRLRTRVFGTSVGYVINISTAVQTTKSYPHFEDCEDEIGNRGGDNWLRLRRRSSIGSRMNGESNGLIYVDYPTIFNQLGLYPRVSYPSDSEMVTKLLAMTNPSRPGFNALAFVGEMKDMPRMIRHAGDILAGIHRPSGLGSLQEAGSAYLAAQFGWAPVLRSLLDMLNFTKQVKKRTEELERLHSEGGLKRRVTLWKGQREVEEETYFLGGPNISQMVRSRSTVKIWGTIKWVPTELPPASFKQAAHSSFFGLNGGGAAAAAWELLPWSWLIDYFTNVGDFLKASNNSVGARPERVNIMTHSKFFHSHDAVPLSSGISVTPGEGIAEEKSRQPIGTPIPSLAFKLPFLSNGQLAILSALLLSRSN